MTDFHSLTSPPATPKLANKMGPKVLPPTPGYTFSVPTGEAHNLYLPPSIKNEQDIPAPFLAWLLETDTTSDLASSKLPPTPFQQQQQQQQRHHLSSSPPPSLKFLFGHCKSSLDASSIYSWKTNSVPAESSSVHSPCFVYVQCLEFHPLLRSKALLEGDVHCTFQLGLQSYKLCAPLYNRYSTRPLSEVKFHDGFVFDWNPSTSPSPLLLTVEMKGATHSNHAKFTGRDTLTLKGFQSLSRAFGRRYPSISGGTASSHHGDHIQATRSFDVTAFHPHKVTAKYVVERGDGKVVGDITLAIGVYIHHEEDSQLPNGDYSNYLTILLYSTLHPTWRRYWVQTNRQTLYFYDFEYKTEKDIVGEIDISNLRKVCPVDRDKVAIKYTLELTFGEDATTDRRNPNSGPNSNDNETEESVKDIVHPFDIHGPPRHGRLYVYADSKEAMLEWEETLRSMVLSKKKAFHPLPFLPSQGRIL